MDIRTALKQGLARLRAASISSHTLAAELLLLHATGRTRTSLYSHPEDQLTESESQNYLSLIERRTAGAPTQHLTGKQEFWGLEFEVTPDVLIPRPETEHLIEVALDRLALRNLRVDKSKIMSGEGLLIAVGILIQDLQAQVQFVGIKLDGVKGIGDYLCTPPFQSGGGLYAFAAG